MKTPKVVFLIVAAMIAGATLTIAVTAGAQGSDATYYGCVSKTGALSKVGETAPTCTGPSTQISWNAQGPAGTAGAAGAQGPVGQASVVNLPPASAFATACPEPPGVTVTATSGPQAYLNIPSIPGESTDPNHLGWIDVLSWSLGATGSNSATACGATGASSGQGSQTQELTVVKNIDSASPALMQSNFVGRGLGTVTLDVTESLPKQTNADYLQYTFTDTIVSSVQWVGSGGDSPMERITMQYAGVSISYQPQNADGTLGSPITACYNVVTQTSC